MLNIIQTNPYRILGVYSNSAVKERVANLSCLKVFLKVGKSIPFQLDLPDILPPVERTDASITDAESKLALTDGQMLYAQFWFLKQTTSDDIAFNYLITGDMSGAVSIWENEENLSSLQNRIVCALIEADYAKAISCAEKLYAGYSGEFINAVLGDNATATADKLANVFLDTLCEVVGSSDIMPHITDENWKAYIGSKSIKPLIETLLVAISQAKESHNQGAEACYEAGVKLMNTAKTTLAELKFLISPDNLKHPMVADRLGVEILQGSINYTDKPDATHKVKVLQRYAQSIIAGKNAKDSNKGNIDIFNEIIMMITDNLGLEILKCGINYFNGSSDKDAAHKTLVLQEYARAIVTGKMAKDRCDENIESLKEIIKWMSSIETPKDDTASKEEVETPAELPDKPATTTPVVTENHTAKTPLYPISDTKDNEHLRGFDAQEAKEEGKFKYYGWIIGIPATALIGFLVKGIPGLGVGICLGIFIVGPFLQSFFEEK